MALGRPSPGGPLIGRRPELEAIQSAFASSPCAAVVVAGPAGVGKSRLAREVADELAAAGRPIVHVIGTQAGAEIPFGAFASILPDKGSSGGASLELLHSLSKAINDRGDDGRPTLLLVDDAHLLDSGSAALVHQLAQLRSCGVIATVRTPDVAPDPITGLWKDGLAERIEVTPLSRDESDALVASYLGGAVASSALRWLWDAGAGNPLFVRELLVGAQESGSVYSQDGIWLLQLPLPAPARLTDLIGSRLSKVAPKTAELVHLLAIGEPLGFAELVGIVGEDAAEDAETRGLVTVREDGSRLDVRLSHPLYAEFLRAQIPAARLRRLSRALAESFEKRGPRRRDDVMRIARWRLDAGALGNPELFEQAARQARAVRDFQLAGRLARAALAVGGGVTAGLVLGEAEFASGRHQEAEKVFADLMPACQTDEERALVVNARAYNLGMLMGDEKAATAIVDEALSTIHEPAARSRLLARQAISHLYSSRLSSALAVAAELENAPDDMARLRGAYATAVAQALLGRGDSAAATAHGAADLHRQLVEQQGQREALAAFQPPEGQLVGAVIGHLASGHLLQADADAQSGYDAGLERSDKELQATFCLLRGWVLIERGLLTQATNLLREGAAINRELADSAPLRWCLAGIALAEAMSGNAPAADLTWTVLQALPDHWMVALDLHLIDRARAWVLLAAGLRTDANKSLRTAAEQARTAEQVPAEALLLHDLARLGEAKSVTERLTELAPLAEGDLVAAFAAHAAARARADGAALEAAAGRFEELGALLLAAEAAFAAADAYAARGHKRKASSVNRDGERRKRLCEADRSPLLASIDAAVPLTPREIEIALLAGSGESSKSVAERLVLSIRTVDNHLQHIYAKLGVTNRAELEAALRQSGLRDPK